MHVHVKYVLTINLILKKNRHYMCSKKDVPLFLPLSSYLGAKWEQKQGLQGGLDVHVPRPIDSYTRFP